MYSIGAAVQAPIFFFGTAGLRRLPVEKQQRLLAAVTSVLQDSPFRS